MNRWVVMLEGRILGWVSAPEFRPLPRGRGFCKRPIYWAFRRDGVRTEFTFPSRKQASDWVVGAAREVKS